MWLKKVTSIPSVKNQFVLYSIVIALVGSSLLTACSTAPVIEQPDVAEPVETAVYEPVYAEFIFPKAQRSPEGEWLPYQPSQDPYNRLPAPVISADIKQQYRAALAEAERGSPDDAKKTLLSITEAAPDLSSPWFQLGTLEADRQQWSDAANFFQQAIKVNEWNSSAWLGLGISQRQQGEMEAAEVSYREALKRWPDFPQAHRNLAILLDLYLNDAVAAQPHYEAYQILTDFNDTEANDWVTEISRRTGIEWAMPLYEHPQASVSTERSQNTGAETE